MGNFSARHTRTDHPRFLILMPTGIGDAITVGLSATDQIIRNDPAAYGKIDIVCNDMQADIFRHDPRINSIIRVNSTIAPTPDMRTWSKGIILQPAALELLHFLRNRHYEAVFPGNTTPIFYSRLHAHIMHMSLRKLLRDFSSLRQHADIPISNMVRQIVNAYFANTLPEPAIGETIPLYISSEHIQRAMTTAGAIKAQASVPAQDCRLLIIAPDASSIVTRPPTALLAQSVADALTSRHELIVYILPSYTDTNAAANLYHTLSHSFDGRIFIMPPEPKPSLLEITALLDQADIFVTGDTGIMHLAITNKRVRENDTSRFSPKNTLKIIALFGGSHPGLYGYSKQTVILGRGRKEQATLIPGIFKEAYCGKPKAFFDHIAPKELTEAISRLLAPRTQ